MKLPDDYRVMLEDAPDAIFSMDLSGRIMTWNPAAAQLFGYSESEAVGEPVDKVVSSDGACGLREMVESVASGVPALRDALCCRRKDGTDVDVEITLGPIRDRSGRAMGVSAIAHRVSGTAHKRAEDALRDSEERYRLAVEGVEDYAIFMLDPEGRVATWNPGAQRILGYSESEVIGQPVASIFTPEDRSQAAPEQELASAARDGSAADERWHVRKDGSRFWASGVLTALYDSAGRLRGFSKIIRDQTERKRAEDQLQLLNATLEERVAERTALAEQQAAQLRALASELTQSEQRERRRLAQILHDHLQQLLVAAKLAVGLQRNRASDDKVREELGHVEELLHESIQASRSLTVELSPPVLYNAGLTPALEWLARWMDEKHGLTVEVDADPEAEPAGEDIRVLLFDAVRELLFNVVKHAKTNKARVGLKRVGDERVEVTVDDRGAGFDPQGLTAAEPGEAGFGLFSIRERLLLLGGTFEIESAPGRGTTAKLGVPRVRPRAAEPRRRATVLSGAAKAEPRTETPRAEPAGKIRVLLADDHEVVRRGLAGLLRQQSDIDVVAEASDGETAIDLARRLHPDVVVMDVNMPHVNGIAATHHITSELPEVRVVVLSFHEEPEMADAMADAGAAAYLTKGGPSENLIAAIRGELPPLTRRHPARQPE